MPAEDPTPPSPDASDRSSDPGTPEAGNAPEPVLPNEGYTCPTCKRLFQTTAGRSACIRQHARKHRQASLPWSDPASDPMADLRQAAQDAKDDYLVLRSP